MESDIGSTHIEYHLPSLPIYVWTICSRKYCTRFREYTTVGKLMHTTHRSAVIQISLLNIRYVKVALQSSAYFPASSSSATLSQRKFCELNTTPSIRQPVQLQ